MRVHKLTQREATAALGHAVAYVSTAAQRTRAGQERMDALHTKSLVRRIMAQIEQEAQH